MFYSSMGREYSGSVCCYVDGYGEESGLVLSGVVDGYGEESVLVLSGVVDGYGEDVARVQTHILLYKRRKGPD